MYIFSGVTNNKTRKKKNLPFLLHSPTPRTLLIQINRYIWDVVPSSPSRGRLKSPEHFFKLPSLVCFVSFFHSSCFFSLALFLFRLNSSSFFFCFLFPLFSVLNSKSFLFESSCSRHLFQFSFKEGGTNMPFIFLCLGFFFLKALTHQSAAAACQQTLVSDHGGSEVST